MNPKLDAAIGSVIARAVRELHALSPDTPTPGFATDKVKKALTNLDPMHAPFLDLEDEARMFQALPEPRRTELLAEWERIH